MGLRPGGGPASPLDVDDTAPSPFAWPAFRAFFVAKLGSTLAQIMMVVVIGWQVYDIARQTMPIREAAFLLGLVGLALWWLRLVLAMLLGD